MILVDTALRAMEAAGSPIRVGIVGAGFMSQGLTNQIVNSVTGMRVVAVAGRHVERAAQVVEYAGARSVAVDSVADLEAAAAAGAIGITADASILATAPSVDILVEATGAVDY